MEMCGGGKVAAAVVESTKLFRLADAPSTLAVCLNRQAPRQPTEQPE
jgi:hypothetical protein